MRDNMEPLKDSKRLSVTITSFDAFVIFALCATLAIMPVVDAQGDIRVFNVIGDPITISNCRDFVGRNLPPGNTVIAPMREFAWRFRGYPTVNRDWTCHFQWSDSSDCASGPCRLRGRDVSLWASVCVDCVWRVHREGFYRRDGRIQPANWQFIFGWE